MNHPLSSRPAFRRGSTPVLRAAVVTVAVGALAASGATAPATSRYSVAVRSTPTATVGTSNSVNWAGYVAQGGTFTSVSGSWVAPSVTCTRGAQQSAFWVGLDGWESDSVEQAGTAANCNGTKATYYAWYEMYPLPFHRYKVPVSPGDALSASITYTGGNVYAVSLADATAGWTETAKVTASGDERLSAEAIAEAPCCTSAGNPQPLSQFSPVTFTNVLANGKPLGRSGLTEVTLVDNAGHQQAVPSALSKSTSFHVTWVAQN